MSRAQVRRRPDRQPVTFVVGPNTCELSGLDDQAAAGLLRHADVPHQRTPHGVWCCPARNAGAVAALAQRLGHRVLLTSAASAPADSATRGLW